MSSLAAAAINIARREYNARNNEGQGRVMEINNNTQNLKSIYGNANVNNALTRARRILKKTRERQKRARQVRATGNRRSARQAALSRVSNKLAAARARAGRAVMAGALRELNNLRWVPVANFRVKRGRSPSPLRSAKRVKNARGYVGSR
jgi:hypothetical protein